MLTDNDSLFSTMNMLAMCGWVILIFSPKRWNAVLVITGILIPTILGVLYGSLMLTHMSSAEGGGYASISQVRALMSYDPVLVAGWAHYLAFDLIVGTLVAKEADKTGISRLVQAPILFGTFMYGPAGLILYLIIHILWKGISERRSVAQMSSSGTINSEETL